MKDSVKLFSNCIPVKGAKRSIICDLQRNDYDFIPNSLYDILKEYDGKKLIDMRELFFTEEEKSNFDKYIDFLLDKEYIFLTKCPDLFPSISMDFEDPSIISNALIDYKGIYDFGILNALIKDLDDLGCQAVQLRFFSEINKKDLNRILEFFDNSGIRSVQLLIKYNSELTLNELTTQFKRVDGIIIYDFKGEKTDFNLNIPILTQRNSISGEDLCGCISPINFTSNISMFMESKTKNSCLNKKVSIDKLGEIKNCPSMSKSYGNIQNVSIKSIISNPEFSELWNINKDQIDICKDCEFRYICTDCRAYTETTNIYSKPKKCNYNPYKGEWEDK